MSPSELAIAQRENTIRLNVAALVALMDRHNFTLPARDFPNWRPLARVFGALKGLEHLGDVQPLCTDGIVAIFLTPDGQLLHGHLKNFPEQTKPLHSVDAPEKKATTKTAKPSKPRRKSPKAAAAALLLEELGLTLEDLK